MTPAPYKAATPLPPRVASRRLQRGTRMKPKLLSCLLVLVACRVQPAQEEKAAPGAELQQAFAKAGLTVDLAAKTVSLQAKMGRPADLLEYVLITRMGKAHEALLIADVEPSVLNAALLALGLTPGS